MILAVLLFSFVVAVLIAPAELVLYLTPVLVWLVTQFVKWVMPKVPGLVILAIAGLLSGVAAFATSLIVPENSWLLQFLGGLLAVVISQVIFQIKSYPTDTSVIKIESAVKAGELPSAVGAQKIAALTAPPPVV